MQAQISILALLLSSETHRAALLRVLNEAYIPRNTSPDKLYDMVGLILATNYISFTDDELPAAGTNHAQALHIAVKTQSLIIGNVLIDNSSAINVCSLVTLKRIGIDSSSTIHMPMAIRAFDGSHQQTMGMVEFPITIGPVLFQIQL